MIVSPRFDEQACCQTATMRLGIMGGTFDPIHLGHLVCAEQAREQFDLDGVIFMPAGKPVRKLTIGFSAAEDRYEMVARAIASNPYFDVSRLELDREGVTYTVDTLRKVREEYPGSVELYFITGADAVLDIVTWKDASQITEMATLIGATRPGYDLEEAKRAHEVGSGDNGTARSGFSISFIEVPALAISSTDLRLRVREHRSIRYLTMPSVIDYIEEKGLYGDSSL